MKQFEIGKEYSMKSACDHNCVWTYTITTRTTQTITISDGKRFRNAALTKKFLHTATLKRFTR